MNMTVAKAISNGWRIQSAERFPSGTFERVAHHPRFGDAIGFGRSLWAVRLSLLQDIEIKESMHRILGEPA